MYWSRLLRWADDVGHHEPVERRLDKAGFRDAQGGGRGRRAGRKLIGPGAAVGCLRLIQQDIAPHGRFGAGREEGHVLAIIEMLDPVVAALVGLQQWSRT